MAELFGLSERELIFFKAQAVACGGWDKFKMNKNEAFEFMVKLCRFLNFDELRHESIAEAAYTSCQDTLLKQENLPVELLLNLPSFNLFGQLNFADLLQAWVDGKESGLDDVFQFVFKEGWEEERAEYAELNRQILHWRLLAFEKYETVADANRLIDRIGLETCAELSTDEFMERLEIRKTRPALDDYEIFLVSACNVASGQLDSVGLDRDGALDFIKTLCENVSLDKGIEQAVRNIYTPAQNALMTFRKDDFYTIQKEPAFSKFGRENLTKLLDAWQTGGRNAVEQTYNEIFSDGWQERRPKQEVIRIVSGDGETPETAIKFSTSEMMERIRMEFCYVYYTFGKDWEHIHFTVPGDNGKTYNLWELDLPDGSQRQIYFDTNRSE